MYIYRNERSNFSAYLTMLTMRPFRYQAPKYWTSIPHEITERNATIFAAHTVLVLTWRRALLESDKVIDHLIIL